jgi:hypothetical protein
MNEVLNLQKFLFTEEGDFSERNATPTTVTTTTATATAGLSTVSENC